MPDLIDDPRTHETPATGAGVVRGWIGRGVLHPHNDADTETVTCSPQSTKTPRESQTGGGAGVCDITWSVEEALTALDDLNSDCFGDNPDMPKEALLDLLIASANLERGDHDEALAMLWDAVDHPDLPGWAAWTVSRIIRVLESR